MHMCGGNKGWDGQRALRGMIAAAWLVGVLSLLATCSGVAGAY